MMSKDQQPRRRLFRSLLAGVGGLALVVGPVASAVPTASPRLTPVARPAESCGPHDRPETGLQGQVPWADRMSGRAAMGYTCNLTEVGSFTSAGFANFDSYRNCVYYTDNRGGTGVPQGEGGGVVLDVSNPRHPVKTAYLRARAMGDGGESLRVNQRRGLLVSDHYSNRALANPDLSLLRTLAVYDLKQDCRHPKLLADVIMPNAAGHEGCFEPDGNAYYMASTYTITPIDLTNPRAPREMSFPWPLTIHGCSISDDGNRGYFSSVKLAQDDSDPGRMLVVDTSQVQQRRANAGYKVLSSLPTPDGNVQQGTLPLTYGNRSYAYDWSEAMSLTPRVPCADANTNFAYGRFVDLTDEKHPREVSRVQTQVMLPENCAAVAADRDPQTQGLAQGDPFWQVVSAAFTYDMHYCRTDRLHNPTILACTQFASGLRVYDIRNPREPREIAYDNVGTVSPNSPEIDLALAPPIIHRDLGMIFWVTTHSGFHAATFRAGVWPFGSSPRCPDKTDYYARQYDLGAARNCP
jgi:hypothetical protein